MVFYVYIKCKSKTIQYLQLYWTPNGFPYYQGYIIEKYKVSYDLQAAIQIATYILHCLCIHNVHSEEEGYNN